MQITMKIVSKHFYFFAFKYLVNNLICSVCIPHSSTPSVRLDAGCLSLPFGVDNLLLMGSCAVHSEMVSVISALYPLVSSNTHSHTTTTTTYFPLVVTAKNVS